MRGRRGGGDHRCDAGACLRGHPPARRTASHACLSQDRGRLPEFLLVLHHPLCARACEVTPARGGGARDGKTRGGGVSRGGADGHPPRRVRDRPPAASDARRCVPHRTAHTGAAAAAAGLAGVGGAVGGSPLARAVGAALCSASASAPAGGERQRPACDEPPLRYGGVRAAPRRRAPRRAGGGDLDGHHRRLSGRDGGGLRGGACLRASDGLCADARLPLLGAAWDARSTAHGSDPSDGAQGACGADAGSRRGAGGGVSPHGTRHGGGGTL